MKFVACFVFFCAGISAIAAQCTCGTGGINIRDAPCGNIIGTTVSGGCVPARAGRGDCVMDTVAYTYVEFDYNGGSGWAADYLVTENSKCGICEDYGLTVVTRAQWGARAPTCSTPIAKPVGKVVVHHTAGAHCYDPASCEATVRGVQNYHMDTQGWCDIGYNFLFGEDGNIYEGRGWDITGTHAGNYNSISIGFSVMGDFTSAPPNQAAQDNVNALMDCGLGDGHLSGSFVVHGHRDVSATACPGDSYYPIVQGHPRWEPALDYTPVGERSALLEDPKTME